MVIPSQSAQPVSTYGDAISWLFTHSRVEDWLFDRKIEETPLPLEARLVAAMFWVNESELVRDLRRYWNGALAPDPLPPFRHKRYAGWR